ncbi:MAG: sel1 repeat family protein [Acinetobacter sp.]|nr:MAG: sel1 repeat family protein [Acinetobacter sp.]
MRLLGRIKIHQFKNWGHQMKKLACTLLLLTSAFVQAGFDEGLAAADKGDYQTAFKEWKPLAEQGYASAQFNLGIMYDNGQGIAQNYTQALYWYNKAAAQGYASAQYNLALMYSNGRGVPQNYTQAVTWYKKAAEQGHVDAQSNLGGMYAMGKGIPQNYKIAYILVNLAASNGDADATQNRDIAAAKLSPAAVADAQRISMQLHNSKNFAADLRNFLNSQK